MLHRLLTLAALLPGLLLASAHAEPVQVQRLSQVLRTAKDYKQRLAAAIGLARLMDKVAVPVLIDALKDGHQTVRGAAAGALGKLGDPRARPALEALIQREKDQYVLGQAQTALATVLRASGHGSGQQGSGKEMQVDGTLGSLDEADAQSGVNGKLGLANACYQRERARVSYLSGKVQLKFRVTTDGKVKWVRLGRSDLGSVAAEQCILTEMTKATFRAPDGGEAEFAIPLGFGVSPAAPDAGVPPEAGKLKKACTKILKPGRPGALTPPPGLLLTVYVTSEGTITSAGLSADGNEIPPAFAQELVTRLKTLSLGEGSGGPIVKITTAFGCSR